jgi:hypothetical protein
MSSELRVVQVTHSPIASCATVSATAEGAVCSAQRYQDVIQHTNMFNGQKDGHDIHIHSSSAVCVTSPLVSVVQLLCSCCAAAVQLIVQSRVHRYCYL